jgi:cytidine deaminase
MPNEPLPDVELIEAATAARGHAHVPYSGFAMGAAVADRKNKRPLLRRR